MTLNLILSSGSGGESMKQLVTLQLILPIGVRGSMGEGEAQNQVPVTLKLILSKGGGDGMKQ